MVKKNSLCALTYFYVVWLEKKNRFNCEQHTTRRRSHVNYYIFLLIFVYVHTHTHRGYSLIGIRVRCTRALVITARLQLLLKIEARPAYGRVYTDR